MASKTSTSVDSNGVKVARQTSSIILDSSSLAKSDYLTPLAELLNDAYSNGHVHGSDKQLLPKETLRLQSGPQQLVDEMGSDGFCVMLLEDPGSKEAGLKKILASGCAKPFKQSVEGVTHGSATNMMFKRAPASPTSPTEIEDPGVSKWELLAFGTDLGYQGQGLAGQITKLVCTDIKRRVDEAAKALGSVNGNLSGTNRTPKIVLLLTTMQELNEEYYKRRGWTTTKTMRYAPGVGGSRDGFGIVEMMKPLD